MTRIGSTDVDADIPAAAQTLVNTVAAESAETTAEMRVDNNSLIVEETGQTCEGAGGGEPAQQTNAAAQVYWASNYCICLSCTG